jgi:NAD(P)-dependent dehydrogenase (short-subunit alcohol dehydrogenase family)
MKGKTCIVTGATSGIGREVALLLAAQGARVIGIGRDWNRCTEACSAIARATGNDDVVFEIADLSSLKEVRALAERLRTRYGRIDVLVNNAGTFTLMRKETTDGLETQLAVNWLAGFLLTGLLLPCLLAAPRARMVTLSSGSHYAGRIHWDDLQLRHGYHGLKAYDQSKLATVLFMAELARRHGGDGRLSTYAVDPGLVKTDIGMKQAGPLVRLVWKLRMRNGIPAGQAADSVAWCAAAPEAEGRSGLYWKEKLPVTPSPRASSREDALRLWSMGEKLCGLQY